MAVYRIMKLAQKTIGLRRTLAIALDVGWVSQRVGQEISWEMYGADWSLRTWGLRSQDLCGLVGPGSTVLDFGCGDGRWALQAAHLGANVTAVDKDQGHLEALRGDERFSEIHLMSALAVKDGMPRFDVALLVHVVEHLDSPQDILETLADVADRLLLETPDVEQDPLNLVRFELDRPTYTDADHVVEYTEESLRELLEKSGWSIDRIWRRGPSLCVEATSTAGAR